MQDNTYSVNLFCQVFEEELALLNQVDTESFSREALQAHQQEREQLEKLVISTKNAIYFQLKADLQIIHANMDIMGRVLPLHNDEYLVLAGKAEALQEQVIQVGQQIREINIAKAERAQKENQAMDVKATEKLINEQL